ncbi:MAG: nitroreductase [Clostridium sp.]|nr:nitroreductase [Clostridium sp.]
MMQFISNITELVLERKSVRTFEDENLSENHLKVIKEELDKLSSPFGNTVKYAFLETLSDEKEASLGTYGIIKGRVNYIGASIKDEPYALEALGYELEKIMLFLTSLNIGTCWLGGTFKREDFKKAMDIEEGELFPAITPVGYPKEKKTMADKLVRFIAKGNQRKPYGELFFRGDFATALDKTTLPLFGEALEMVRLGPSASNKQPWRVLYLDNVFHFYLEETPGYSKSFPYNIQRIDMGIAACHFELTCKEKGIDLAFSIEKEPDVKLGENMHYSFTFSPK